MDKTLTLELARNEFEDHKDSFGFLSEDIDPIKFMSIDNE